MKYALERIAAMEESVENSAKNITALWEKVNDLMAFKNQMEGGMKTFAWIMAFVGLSNLAILVRILIH